MAVSIETFRRVALEDDSRWEYRGGRLVPKPGGTFAGNAAIRELVRQLTLRLDDDRFTLRSNSSHMVLPRGQRVVPDVAVIPRAVMERLKGRPFDLEEYTDPLPFVAEVWSRSTGDYDVDEKFPAYRERGDLEIWRIHPYEKTVIAWRRQADGSYSEARYDASSGPVPVASLPVTIDLVRLFRY